VTGVLALAAVALASSSGLLGLALRHRPALGQRLSAGALCLAAVLGFAAAVPVLAGAPASVIHLAWSQPFASLSFRLDALSALFLLPILLVPALGAVYGVASWPQRTQGACAVRLQLWYGIVAGSMALVLLADNAMVFLFAWELMALCGFFLVRADPDRKDAQKASWIYLAAAHVGTFAIVAFFAAVGSARGSFDFSAWSGLRSTGATASWLALLSLVGFGLKAGLVPLHFWLPGAHAAAPSHVSAVMSGVLLKTGIYGLLRTAGFFEAPPASWGVALMVLGGISGVLGVALALAQHDLKRLLAYHSVENIGIITMGMGLAMLGRSLAAPGLVLLGFAGAALHVVNHGLFKSLLFLGAGSVQHATGTRDVERLGGLARAMPWTSGLFLVGAAAISGLPPLNGFVSEWFVALGALSALELPLLDRASFAVLVAPVLALIGALAAACFVKVQGTVFLGNPRTQDAARARESPGEMLVPMAVLAAACVGIGLAPALVVAPLARGAAAWSGMDLARLAGPAGAAAGTAGMVTGVAVLLVAIVVVLWLLRRRLGAGVAAGAAETWSCGYAHPTARMAYTGSSFAQILNQGFRWVLFPRVRFAPPRGPFPTGARFSTEPREAVLDLALLPAVRDYISATSRVRRLIAGRLHLQALLVLATLVAMLAWRLLWW
jgi:formate hydrogenlyase subunit 3/multisubunit Na+/H+ antiporter MnhD subunit